MGGCAGRNHSSSGGNAQLLTEDQGVAAQTAGALNRRSADLEPRRDRAERIARSNGVDHSLADCAAIARATCGAAIGNIGTRAGQAQRLIGAQDITTQIVSTLQCGNVDPEARSDALERIARLHNHHRILW